MKEFNNRASRCINRHFHNSWFEIVTFFNILYAKFIGVHILGHVKFNGWTSFFRSTDSKLDIGKNCIFNSVCYKNHIGINHRCILSVTPPDDSKKGVLKIGDNCGFSGTSIWCFDKIIIGNNVRCGANTLIMDGDAHFEDPRTSNPQPIILKDNVFLGANVVVKKGVTIGENTVIGMNSVVTHDIPANSIAVGIPCKVIKTINIK